MNYEKGVQDKAGVNARASFYEVLCDLVKSWDFKCIKEPLEMLLAGTWFDQVFGFLLLFSFFLNILFIKISKNKNKNKQKKILFICLKGGVTEMEIFHLLIHFPRGHD